MPEGHSVHRIARQLGLDLVGRRLAVSSPQGRFAAGAGRIDGQVLVASRAVGKQLFLEFESGDILRVHLGLYGAWDFYGRLTPLAPGDVVRGSMGAPRVRRAVRMGEEERGRELGDGGDFPPAPVGQVRVRLASDETVADLRGPSACEVIDLAEAAAVVARLGPDPVTAGDEGRDVMVGRLTSRNVAVGQLLMDQAVVSGIGNIYRAELLFRARLDPHTPGRLVPREVAGALWDDWSLLLADGIRTGFIVTRDVSAVDALADPSLRHWVYHRTGLPCLVSGTPVVVEVMATRNLYWCPTCQV